MILAIDAGNTRIKWGVHDGTAWKASGAVASADAQGLAAAWSAVPRGTRVIASNVAGAGIAEHIARACAKSGLAPTFIVSRESQLGVANGYRDPRQLGSDRWAALIGAHHLHAGNKLVVNAGTALTVDALTAQGQFLGGLIAPGPALMRRSLDQGTAGLRLAAGRFDAFPASTPDAITSGAIQACAGAIDRMRAAMQERGAGAELIVLSGGAAAELHGQLSLPCAMNENLVLDGLLFIARDDRN